MSEGEKLAEVTLHTSGVARPDVTVIIPHYNDLRRLDQCLDALNQQVGVESLTVEVIVADNNSPGGREEVETIVAGRARVICATIKGAGPARNAGIAEARGTYLAFTDCDCLPDDRWLAKGLTALRDFDLVGGRMTVLRAAAGEMSGAEAFERVFAFQNEHYIKDKGFTVTANLFCKRETAHAIGDFRTQLSEDFEWCQRATMLGFKLGYAQDAVVGHPARENWAELKRKWRRINRETHALYIENGRGLLSWLGKTWFLPISILPHAFKVLTSDNLIGLDQRAKAIATLTALRFWRFWDQHRLLFESP